MTDVLDPKPIDSKDKKAPDSDRETVASTEALNLDTKTSAQDNANRVSGLAQRQSVNTTTEYQTELESCDGSPSFNEHTQNNQETNGDDSVLAVAETESSEPKTQVTHGDGQRQGDDRPQFEDLSTARKEFSKSGQTEMPFALVQGQAMTQLPLDLYIPPDALEVILEQFEGPLDLLLYLIRKQNLDILSVNVADITEQYMQYVELMKTVQLELAGEYLVMAAMLAEIKSRILLPRPEKEEDEESDPRAELIRRLQDYERFKKAAEDLDDVPRASRDFHTIEIKSCEYTAEKQHPDVNFKDLMLAFSEVLHRADMYVEHEVQKEKLSTRERMSSILSRLQHTDHFIPFNQLFTLEEGRGGVVVTFLATLELIKEQLIEIVQDEIFGPIHVKAKSV